MITKNSVVKIQNLAVNHESWAAKSNPVVSKKSGSVYPMSLFGFCHCSLSEVILPKY